MDPQSKIVDARHCSRQHPSRCRQYRRSHRYINWSIYGRITSNLHPQPFLRRRTHPPGLHHSCDHQTLHMEKPGGWIRYRRLDAHPARPVDLVQWSRNPVADSLLDQLLEWCHSSRVVEQVDDAYRVSLFRSAFSLVR